jgi:hypothetical protein
MEVRQPHSAGRQMKRVMVMVVSSSEPELREHGPAPRRLPLVVEALGYLGAVLAVIAGLIAALQLWPTITVGAQLAFAAAAAAALLLVGIMLPTRSQPAMGRLRSVLWLTSAAALAAAGALLTGPHFGNMGPAARPLVTEAAVTAYAVILWWRSRATLQHLAAFAGTAALAATALAQTGPVYDNWRVGAGLWVLALLWGITVHRGYLVPRTAGYAVAGVGLLVGTQLTILELSGAQPLAIVTVAGLLAAGVALRRVLLLGLGALGAVVMFPQVASQYLPGGAGGAAAVMAAGVVILGVALWLARTRTKPS